jgi:UDP-N-acetylmuramate--alanine ligase
MRRVGLIHFIGIGGAGMGGIAEVLVNLGYAVRDPTCAPMQSPRAREDGRRHLRRPRRGADCGCQRRRRLLGRPPTIPSGRRFAASVVQRPRCSAAHAFPPVSPSRERTGNHDDQPRRFGARRGARPTFVIGLLKAPAATPARRQPLPIAEADERRLVPAAADGRDRHQHRQRSLGHGGDFEKLKQSFVEFLHNLPFYGLAVLCSDDPVVRELLPLVGRPMIRYGLGEDADLRATALEQHGAQTRFQVERAGRKPLPVTLNLPGRHNVCNALAAIAVATELEVDDTAIQRALAAFEGIGRRLETIGDVKTSAGSVTIVDDYGHHPTEIEATLEAARQAWPGRRLVLAFQPHRYTRTHDLIDDFGRVLSEADALLVTEVYAAGEEPIANADGRAICRAVRGRGRIEPVFVEDVHELPAALAGVIEDHDVVLTMGAGSIGAVAHELPVALAAGAGR